MPQGSVLGPILFLLYTADLLHLVRSHHLTTHAYADDLQIYRECSPADVVCLQDSVSACVDDVACWMAVNQDRSALVLINTPSAPDPRSYRSHEKRSRATCIQCTRAYDQLDGEVTMSAHVSAVVKASFAALRRFRSVRRSTPRRALLTLIRAVVSKVNYCNSVLGGVSDSCSLYWRTAGILD